MIERAVIWSVALFGLMLLLSTCGAEADCVRPCAVAIWAVTP